MSTPINHTLQQRLDRELDQQKLRDGMIHNAVEQRRVDDTKILQKVNAVNREAFLTKFPGQIEHMMRLTSERLQFCLSKHDGVDLSRPSTWPAQPDEIMSLAHALRSLNELHQEWCLKATHSD